MHDHWQRFCAFWLELGGFLRFCETGTYRSAPRRGHTITVRVDFENRVALISRDKE